MSAHIPGTWRFVKALKKDGTPDPSQAPGLYTFNADGSGSFDMPGGFALPMKWKIVDGRLCFGGARGAKGQSTVDFEMPDPNTLVMIIRHSQRAIYERVKQPGA